MTDDELVQHMHDVLSAHGSAAVLADDYASVAERCAMWAKRYALSHLAPPRAETKWAFCDLCDGTGSFPDADHPCGNCGGRGEVEYIPVPIRRKDG